MQKHEERIGVRIPGVGQYMVNVMVGPFDSDEEVLARISQKVGTVFNVLGTKYEVVSGNPFKLKKLPNPDDEDGTPEEEHPKPKAEDKPKPAKKEAPAKEDAPASKRREAPSVVMPQVGERWKPRDPRRIASFTVVAVESDHVVTDDGRHIQLARFPRYEKVPETTSKAS
jgi:hypothetical protein